MANRWGHNGNRDRLYFLGSKIPLDGDCSHEIKRLSLWKKSYDQPRQPIKKQRHYFANKGLYSESYGFPVVIYACESWTIKQAECWRTDAFELWRQRRFLSVLWTARRPTQLFLKEINPEYSLEELMLKLKLQYFGHLMQRADSLEKTLMLGKTKGKWRRGQRRTRWLDGIINSMTWVWASSRRRWWTGMPRMLQSRGSQSWTRFSNWKQQQCSFLKKLTLNHVVKIKTLFWAKVKILIHSKNIYWPLKTMLDSMINGSKRTQLEELVKTARKRKSSFIKSSCKKKSVKWAYFN